jgi:polyisoprenoid-binding protein YceI
MTRNRWLLSFLFLLLLGGAVGVVGVWYFFFNDQAPAVASIDDAAGSVSSPAPTSSAGDPSTGTTGTTDPTDPTANPSAPTSGSSADGTWTVDNSIGSYSDYSSAWAGFRVAEVLDNIGDTEAVGRTPDVTGTLTLDGQALAAATIEVDLTSITSDQSRRDPAIQRTLETSSFPTATFTLSEPVALPSAPAEGVSYDLVANGALTIHGVTQNVQAALQARLVNGVIVVAGSTPFTFSDYGMSAPRAPIVLSVDDHGTVEFQLFFTRA